MFPLPSFSLTPLPVLFQLHPAFRLVKGQPSPLSLHLTNSSYAVQTVTLHLHRDSTRWVIGGVMSETIQVNTMIMINDD